ncbi:cyclopropane fatty acyl phospholipid synthase [Chitinophaga lutea]
MQHSKAKDNLIRLLNLADIGVEGKHPWDIRVQSDAFYPLAWAKGSLGLGESYMAGWWDCDHLDEFFSRLLRFDLDAAVRKNTAFKLQLLFARLFNFQKVSDAFTNGQHHYDIGNDLFRLMLDRRMTYTCAFWEQAPTLDEAQEAKLDLTCRKLHLRPGMRVLDIGCGWGSFARFAAEKYGVSVTGVTVSEEQAALARERCNGLPVEIRLCDYRDVRDKFDAIVSLGMFEHVGARNYRTYMQVAHRCLRPEGLFLLHTIGGNKVSPLTDRWLDKYIFPHAVIPAIRQIGKAIEGLFVMEHWQNFSVDYDKTLMAWHHNVNANRHLLSARYDGTFFRMWEYYLLSCAGAFRARATQLWQIVLSPKGVPGGYSFQ